MEYWAALNKIFNDEQFSNKDKNSQGPKSRKEFIENIHREQADLEKWQSRIQDLPVRDVDEDLINFMHETSEALQKVNMAYVKASVFVSQLESEDENLGSFDNIAKHFFRGFSGDFTSSFKEMDNLQGERKAQWQAIRNEMMVAMEGLYKIRSDQIPLRALLTKRYGVEFR